MVINSPDVLNKVPMAMPHTYVQNTKKERNSIMEKFINSLALNVINYCVDEYNPDEGEIFFLDNVHEDGWNCLYLLIVHVHNSVIPMVYMVDENDNHGCFKSVTELGYEAIGAIIQNINSRMTSKENLIKKIKDLVREGKNIPKNYVVNSIKDRVLEKTESGNYQIGEVTLVINGSIDISIVFPSVEDVEYSYDTPLSELEYDELLAIWKKLKR